MGIENLIIYKLNCDFHNRKSVCGGGGVKKMMEYNKYYFIVIALYVCTFIKK